MNPKYTVIMFVVGILMAVQPTLGLGVIDAFWGMLHKVTMWLSNDNPRSYGMVLAFFVAPLTILYWKRKA